STHDRGLLRGDALAEALTDLLAALLGLLHSGRERLRDVVADTIHRRHETHPSGCQLHARTGHRSPPLLLALRLPPARELAEPDRVGPELLSLRLLPWTLNRLRPGRALLATALPVADLK